MSVYFPKIEVVDLETTGLEATTAAPIELGTCNVIALPDLLGDPDFRGAKVAHAGAYLLDPGMPIPPEASAIHHLVDADLAGKPPWRDELGILFGAVRASINTLRDPSCIAFAAHNAKFERQWLTPAVVGPAPWICTWKCSLRAWPDAPGHGNQVLRYWLGGQGLLAGLDRERASPAHRAGPDAYVTAFLLCELLREHPLDTLIRWSDEPAALIHVPFGKRPEEGGSRGVRWTEVDDGFLQWVAERDFDEDILHTVRLERARRARLEALGYV